MNVALLALLSIRMFIVIEGHSSWTYRGKCVVQRWQKKPSMTTADDGENVTGNATRRWRIVTLFNTRLSKNRNKVVSAPTKCVLRVMPCGDRFLADTRASTQPRATPTCLYSLLIKIGRLGGGVKKKKGGCWSEEWFSALLSKTASDILHRGETAFWFLMPLHAPQAHWHPERIRTKTTRHCKPAAVPQPNNQLLWFFTSRNKHTKRLNALFFSFDLLR